MESAYETDCAAILEFSTDDLKYEESALLFRLGYPGREAVSEPVRKVLDELAEPLRLNCSPKAIARFVRFDFPKNPPYGFCIPGGYVFSTVLVSQALASGRVWAVFALTVGEPEQLKQGKEGGDLLREYCADAIFSVMAETLAQAVEKRLAGLMEAHGMAAGFRYSPGYCDWPLSDNRELLALADAQKIGIRLTEGGMMTPRKSVSGVMAFGEPGSEVREPACRRCKERCPHYRR